jgi:hypothetical protein
MPPPTSLSKHDSFDDTDNQYRQPELSSSESSSRITSTDLPYETKTDMTGPNPIKTKIISTCNSPNPNFAFSRRDFQGSIVIDNDQQSFETPDSTPMLKVRVQVEDTGVADSYS